MLAYFYQCIFLDCLESHPFCCFSVACALHGFLKSRSVFLCLSGGTANGQPESTDNLPKFGICADCGHRFIFHLAVEEVSETVLGRKLNLSVYVQFLRTSMPVEAALQLSQGVCFQAPSSYDNDS